MGEEVGGGKKGGEGRVTLWGCLQISFKGYKCTQLDAQGQTKALLHMNMNSFLVRKYSFKLLLLDYQFKLTHTHTHSAELLITTSSLLPAVSTWHSTEFHLERESLQANSSTLSYENPYCSVTPS